MTPMTHGMAMMPTITSGTSTASSTACAWAAKSLATSRPSPSSVRANSGTKPALKAPLGEQAAQKFGSLKATKNASATGPHRAGPPSSCPGENRARARACVGADGRDRADQAGAAGGRGVGRFVGGRFVGGAPGAHRRAPRSVAISPLTSFRARRAPSPDCGGSGRFSRAA